MEVSGGRKSTGGTKREYWTNGKPLIRSRQFALQEESMSLQPGSFYEDLYPRGLRKFLAIGVICMTTFVPAVIVWKDGPEPAPQARPGFVPGWGGLRRGTAVDARPAGRSRLPLGRTLLAVFGSVLGLALYYPRWGFKRYALLCGPILGVGSMIVVGSYLSGRTAVYRFEIVFAALFGAVPGVALYVLLSRRKWRKKHAAETIWIE